MILGGSFSHWSDVRNWKAMKAQGVEYAWIRATQGTSIIDTKLDSNCKGAQDAGMIVGLYHVQVPNVDQFKQAEYFTDYVRMYNPDMIAMDYEIYWTDILHKEETKIAPKEICTRGKLCRDNIHSLYPEKKLFTYTGAWFVSDYTRYSEYVNGVLVKKSALDWLTQDAMWWVDWGGYRRFMGWLTNHTLPEALEKMPTDFHLDPTYPMGFTTLWKFWQFNADMYKIPEDGSSFEFNAFNGTIEDLRKLIGAPVVLPLTLEERVARLEDLHGLSHF